MPHPAAPSTRRSLPVAALMAAAPLALASCAAAANPAAPAAPAPAMPPAAIHSVIAGEATATTAQFNARTADGGWIEAVLACPAGTEHPAGAATTREARHAVLRFEGLEPDTPYELRIHGERRGATRTMPAEPGHRPIRIAFGSCLNPRAESVNVVGPDGERVRIRNHQIFPLLAEEQYDAFLLIGDRFYLPNPYEFYDGLDEEEAIALFDQYHVEMIERLPHFADVLSRTPTYTIWDDHDYGPNDSAANFRFKHIAMRALVETYANPPMGEPGNPGCYFAASFGPHVDAFLLDCRTFRDCAYNTTRGGGLLCRPAIADRGDGVFEPDPLLEHCFGPRQMAWLKSNLMASTADIKLVVAGGQFLSDIHPWEAWHNFAEREEFLDWLAESRIPGVVFLSGDRHTGEIGWMPDRGPYPWYEATSSGMAVNVFGPDAQSEASDYEYFEPVASTHHYAVVEVNPEARTIAFALRTLDGEIIRRVVPWSDLQP